MQQKHNVPPENHWGTHHKSIKKQMRQCFIYEPTLATRSPKRQFLLSPAINAVLMNDISVK